MRKLFFLFAFCFWICSPAEAAAPPTVRKGDTMPVFTLPSRDGGVESFGGGVERSKYTLVANVATGCGYSLLSIEYLGKILKKYGDKLDMVTVWCDPTREVWLDTQKEYKSFIEWMDLWDERGLFDTCINSKISPTFILLSPDNKVVKIIKAARFKKILRILNKL